MATKVFCTCVEAKQTPDGTRTGFTWTELETEELRQEILRGECVASIAKKHFRSSWAIICKAITKCFIFVEGENYRYYSNEEEPKMATENTSAVIIETKTFIQGRDAATCTDESIFELISALEARIAKANAIVNKPKRLINLIEKMQSDIDLLVAFVDNRG